MSYPLTSALSPTPGYVYYDQTNQYGQPQGFSGSGVAYPQAPVQLAPTPAPPARSEIVIPPLQTAPPPQQYQLQQMPEVSKEVRLGGPSTPETIPVVRVQEHHESVDPCCTIQMSALCFCLAGLVTFIIVVTVTSQLVFGNDRQFCNNYVSPSPPQFSPAYPFPQTEI
jgi:hypothetical protein